MKKGISIAWVLSVSAFSAFAYADTDTCDQDEIKAHAEQSEIILYDNKGIGFTDLMMTQGKKIFCVPRTPKLDVKTLKNAKLSCEAKNGRLPRVSELNNLSAFIAENYLLEKKQTDRAVLGARFMTEERPMWTATVEKDGDQFHYRRALAKLTHLASRLDMSKVTVEWAGTHLDNKEERPYLCIFKPAKKTKP